MLVACAHFDKLSKAPRDTLLAALAERTAPGAATPRSLPPSLVVWGGDCDKVCPDESPKSRSLVKSTSTRDWK